MSKDDNTLYVALIIADADPIDWCPEEVSHVAVCDRVDARRGGEFPRTVERLTREIIRIGREKTAGNEADRG